MVDAGLYDDELGRLVELIGACQPVGSAGAALRRIELLERLRNATAAAIARQTVAFASARSEEQVAAGARLERIRSGIVGELALARRQSPHAASQHLGWAKVMLAELPETLDVLTQGRTTERRAVLVARETAWLSREHRADVDRAIAPELPGLGDAKTEHRARTLAIRLDPAWRVRRLAMAESERRVSLRPAPDSMAWLSALLPLTQGVAVLATLKAAADTAPGDGRGRGQMMADTLVERVTGQATAEAVPLAVDVILPAGTLLAAGTDRDAPATIAGYGPVPADVARELIRRTAGAEGGSGGQVPMWIRRLYADPKSGALVTMESRSRFFTDAQREFPRLRDQVCRTPYCSAPIRQADHVGAAVDGGPTSVANGQGLCEACNYAKASPGWRSKVESDGTVVITTPSGFTYRSQPPSLAPPQPMPRISRSATGR